MVLQGYFNWDEERVGENQSPDRAQRDMWSHLYTWLIPSEELAPLVDDLKKRSFMGRWMPEAGDVTDAAYLAEMPWAEAANEYPREWQQISPRRDEDQSFEVVPAWEGYLWESGIWDCSLEESVTTSLPAALLSQDAAIEWVPGTRSWRNSSGTTVAQFRSSGQHRALLVRESWLKASLKQRGWGLVIGWLGEKRLFPPGWESRLVGDWTEMNGVASFGEDGFRIAASVTKQVSQATYGDE